MKHQHKNSEFHLAPEELRQLIEAAPTLRDRVLVQILAFTGMRRAEACSLLRADLDLHRRRVLVRNGKGGKQRIVFLSEEVGAAIGPYLATLKAPYLFPGRKSGPMSLRNVNYIVKHVGELAGVESPNPRHRNVTPHLLRHSFARNWKRAGGSMESLQKILGHASLRTTMDVYGTEGLEDTETNYRTVEDSLVSAKLPRIPKVGSL